MERVRVPVHEERVPEVVAAASSEMGQVLVVEPALAQAARALLGMEPVRAVVARTDLSQVAHAPPAHALLEEARSRHAGET